MVAQHGTMTMMISAIILTQNSESTLEQTLQSLDWCDERIVVDDESLDKTLSIAKKAGATVFQHSSNDDFAAQRNWALEKATGDWILFVDSDEVVTKDLATEIQSEIQKGEAIGYIVKRKDFLWRKWLTHGESSRVELLRLAKKGSGKWRRPVHEVWDVKGPTKILSQPLLHYPHPNVAQFIEEINRYSTINARFLKSQGVHVRWWEIFTYPKAKVFVDYIWYLGFLDGTPGAVHAMLMSFHSFLTRAKLYLLWQKHEA